MPQELGGGAVGAAPPNFGTVGALPHPQLSLNILYSLFIVITTSIKMCYENVS